MTIDNAAITMLIRCTMAIYTICTWHIIGQSDGHSKLFKKEKATKREGTET